MAHVTPQFNIKTGADSSLFFSREITINDVNNTTVPEKAVGRIKTGAVEQDSDVFNYPQLTRRTGHSIKGSTESIESNELRKGRTKSAPRKGNSSSSGSLDIELSPETYDDIFEAALRNKWKPWSSDENSAIKFDFKGTLTDGQFISNGSLKDKGLTAQYLTGWKSSPTRKDAIVIFEDEAEANQYEIDELTCGTQDIKYSALAQYGGIEGEDLYQEFEHLAVNTMSLSVSPGQIVTGSFGFMGANNPDLLQTGQAYTLVETNSQTDFDAGLYYTTADGVTFTKATGSYSAAAQYYTAPSGIIEELADDETRSKEGRFFVSAVGDTITGKTPAETKEWVDDLANKVGTSTDQFTAREGFLYINGHRVQYGSNLTFELNNGLKQIFAIFEKGAISTAPMSLDITGTLDAYLIKGHSEELYNMCTGDKDVEITFCFQDKEDHPDYLYVMQIFKAKFTDTDISQGSEELTVSLPFQSFEERACRFFRIRRKVMDVSLDTTDYDKVTVTLADKPADETGLTVSVIDNGVNTGATAGSYDPATGEIEYTFSTLSAAIAHEVVVKMAYVVDGVKRVRTKVYNVAKRS